MTPIERCLSELRRGLPLLAPRRRILAEVEDHLREAAAASDEQEALRRLGPPAVVARGFAAPTQPGSPFSRFSHCSPIRS